MIKYLEDYANLIVERGVGAEIEIGLVDYLQQYTDEPIMDLEITSEEDVRNSLHCLGVVSVVAYDQVYDCRVVHKKYLETINAEVRESDCKYYFHDFEKKVSIPLEDARKVFIVF